MIGLEAPTAIDVDVLRAKMKSECRKKKISVSKTHHMDGNMIHSGNTIAKIVQPNKGKHIAVAGDINTIIASKEDTGGTYSFTAVRI